MALDQLLAALHSDADAESTAILDAARAEAARLDEAAVRDRSARLAAELADARRAREDAAHGAIAEATRRLRGEMLAARAEMLERVRAAVVERAARAPIAAIADRLVDAALAAAGDRAARVRCAPELADRARRHAPDGAEVAVDGVRGVIVELAGDRGEVEATLAACVERAWPELAIAAVARIDGEGDR